MTPGLTPANLAEYRGPGLAGIFAAVSGPDGDVWFVGTSDGLKEVVGRVTPHGVFTLHTLAQGSGFDGITAGPDGDVWFTESLALKVGRIVPTTGAITEYPVPVPAAPSGAHRNTQVTDIVAGPDGALWFDVTQIGISGTQADGYVGRISSGGAVTLTEVPNRAQPIGISVGADGSLWSRVAVAETASVPCGALPGYTPTSTVLRVTTDGHLSTMDEASPGFDGYAGGADGSRWWMNSTGVIVRVSASGTTRRTEALGVLGFWGAFRLAVTRSGDAWFCDGSNVRRLTAAGTTDAYHSSSENGGASQVFLGPDGRVWFVEAASGAATLGAFTPPPAA